MVFSSFEDRINPQNLGIRAVKRDVHEATGPTAIPLIHPTPNPQPPTQQTSIVKNKH